MIFDILPLSTANMDTRLKFELYEQEGVMYYVIIYLDDRVAKVYRLNSEGRYIKMLDASDEQVTFALRGCRIGFDFWKVWG